MRSAVRNSTGQTKSPKASRVIFSAAMVCASLAIIGAGIVLLYFQSVVWDHTENVEFTLRVLHNPAYSLVLLLILYVLIGITITDLVKKQGWSSRTGGLAFCVLAFNIYAIIYYWSRQLWLAKRGTASDGLVFQFSLRNLLFAISILSFTLFALATLWRLN